MPGQWMAYAFIELSLLCVNAPNQLAEKTNGVALERRIVCVCSAAVGMEMNREVGRAHAHYPKFLGALRNQYCISLNAPTLEVCHESAWPILLGDGFFVANYSGQQ